MKAIVQERFGPPDVLQLVDTDVPEVGADDVLVRVHAAALNPYDWHVMRGDPLVARLMGGVGLTRPKARVAGVDAAGQVEAVGANVRGLRHGDEVLGLLVNGAAGGVGTFAVQIAAALDAEVTAVCSKGNVELVRSIGAAHVIDYTTEDFTDGRARYDVILDNVCDRPLRELRRAVIPTGTLVLNGGGPPGRVVGAVGSILRVVVVNAVVRERLRLFPH
jgi:NADPH:quinone reductase-like Zn-dependent oxidoreductase